MRSYIFISFVTILLTSCNTRKGNASDEASTINNDSTYKVFNISDNYKKVVKYFPDGKPQKVEFYKYNLKAGVWKDYSQNGDIIDAKLYIGDSLMQTPIDKNDYYFKKTKIDSFLTMSIPEKWSVLHEDDTMFAVRKDSTKAPFAPNIVVLRGSKGNLPTDSIGIENAFIKGSLIKGKDSQYKIISKGWATKNTFVTFLLQRAKGIEIGYFEYILIGDEYYYIVYSSAYNGSGSDFNKYYYLYEEILYSLNYKGKDVFGVY